MPFIRVLQVNSLIYIITQQFDVYLTLNKFNLHIFTLHIDFANLNVQLSGLRQFLATESPLKMVKNAF